MFKRFLVLLLVLSFFIGQLEFLNQDFLLSKIASIGIIMSGLKYKLLRHISVVGKIMLLLWGLSIFVGIRLFGFQTNWLDVEWLLAILIIESLNTLFFRKPYLFDFYRNLYIVTCIFFSIILLLFGDNSWSGRSTIFGLNQNYLSIILVIALLECILKWKDGEQSGLGLVVLSLLYALAIFSTGSRTGLISLVLCALVALLWQSKATKKTMKMGVRYLAVLTFFTFVILVVLSDPLLLERMQDAVFDSDLSGRDLYWLEMPTWVGENWFFGIGHSGLSIESIRTYGEIRNAHNLYIEMYVRTGVFGLIIILWLIVYLIKFSITSLEKERSLTFIVLFLMLSFVAHPMTTLPLWIFGLKKI